MTELRVDFVGICTHILPVGRTAHRVVVPVDPEPIDPHVAYLWIDGKENDDAVRAFADSCGMAYVSKNDYHKIRLHGVELGVGNADTNDAYALDGSFLCGIPRMSDHSGTWMGRPHPRATNARDDRFAHAYFNVLYGRLSAELLDNGAEQKPSIAVLNVRVSEENPRLHARGFDVGADEVRLTLMESKQIWIEHSGPEDSDRPEDFFIHYEVASNRPHNPTYPKEQAPCLSTPGSPSGRKHPPFGISLGPGCSNSTFP